MSSQWGRDSQVPSARSGGVGSIAAVLLALLIGGAASYGYLRFVQPIETGEATALQGEVTALRDTLASREAALSEAQAARTRAETQLQQLPPADAADGAELSALREQLARQAAELDAMTERLAQASAAETEAAETAGAALQADAAERQALASDLDEAKATVLKLQQQNDRLEAELSAARAAAAKGTDARDKELGDLRDRVVPALTAETEQLRRTVEDLTQGNATARAENTRLSADMERLTRERDESAAGLDRMNRQAAADRQAQQAVEDRLAQATARIAALEAELARATAAPSAPALATPPEPSPSATPSDASPQARPPRTAAEVDAALVRAPGLDRLTPEDAGRLKTELVKGACVTDALETVFTRVPVITLRNLIRDLNSDC